MRVHSAVLALLLLSSAAAFGDSIDRISPSTIYAFNPEQFISIFGTGLAGTVSTVVTYTGDGGQFSVDASDASSTRLDVWVPVGVTNTPGQYAIDVYATDATGVRHIGPATLDVIVQQVEAPPLLGVPEIVIANATSPAGAAVSFTVTAESQGGTGLTFGCNHASGSDFPLGTTTVTCTATDSFGTSTGSFLVVVSDYGIPTINVPADIVTSSQVVTFTVTATDAIDPSPDVHCSPASGSTFAFGTTTVQCFAEDNGGNFAFGSFHVTVTGGPPQLIVPDDMEVEATGTLTPVTYTVEVFDGTVSCSPASGSGFPLGTTTVTCTATNNIGSTSGSFTVTVLDRTPPALTLPADITAEAMSIAGATVPYVATATDLVDGNVTPSCTPISGSTFPFGTTTVQCTATDAHGNTAEGSFNVTVQDTTPPEIVASANPSSLWPPDHKMVAVTVTAIVTDAVDANPLVHIVSVTSDQPENGTGDGDVAPDWEITGAMTVNLRSERAQNVDRTYTITVEAQDFSGNVSQATVMVKVTQPKRRAG